MSKNVWFCLHKGKPYILIFVLVSNLSEWLEKTLSEKRNNQVPKLVTVVNPGNPSGAYIPLPILQVH
jgi:histidinol-phosphate/aromatic aminotransferase/cobyric acid decarboxylase-like protein